MTTIQRPTGLPEDVAIVHDWMPGLAGGERVVGEMAKAFPGSTIYTLIDFLTPEERQLVTSGRPLHVSQLNGLPGVKKYYRYLVLAYTHAIERFDVTGHEIVLSSSAAFAKGVLTSPDQKHFAYVHSPARYAWDLTHEYIDSIGGIGGAIKRMVARRMMHKFRIWDQRTAPSVDYFIANSDFIRRRIYKVYRREADVIYPPVNTDDFTIPDTPRGEHFVTVSRMVPYKRIPLIVEAFAQRPDLTLHVVGDGPEMAAVRAAAGPNIKILGHLPFAEMRDQMQTARAFVFAAKEDFGIVPVEAQACGTPVIALGVAGTAETVVPLGRDAPTGLWFGEQTVESLTAALDQFVAEESQFSAETCRTNALRFSEDRFQQELINYIAERAS